MTLTTVRVLDFKGFVDNNIRVDFEKLLAHRYTLANASTIRPIHSTKGVCTGGGLGASGFLGHTTRSAGFKT